MQVGTLRPLQTVETTVSTPIVTTTTTTEQYTTTEKIIPLPPKRIMAYVKPLADLPKSTQALRCPPKYPCTFEIGVPWATNFQDRLKVQHAILFELVYSPKKVYQKLNTTLMNSIKQPKQLYIFEQLESPYFHKNVDLIKYDGFFDASFTYRRDSTFYLPYSSVVYLKLKYWFNIANWGKKNVPYPTEHELHEAYSKQELTAWKGVVGVISNCRSEYRNNLVSKLIPFLTWDNSSSAIDLYGGCSEQLFKMSEKYRTKRSIMKGKRAGTWMELPKLLTGYKFYLSFENSKCKDYKLVFSNFLLIPGSRKGHFRAIMLRSFDSNLAIIMIGDQVIFGRFLFFCETIFQITEKFFSNALDSGAVPIVAGADREVYQSIAPKGSFIHVDDFETIEELGKHVSFLLANPKEYSKYHAWRKVVPGNDDYLGATIENYENMGHCGLCKSLHLGREYPKIQDLRTWWYGDRNKVTTCEF